MLFGLCGPGVRCGWRGRWGCVAVLSVQAAVRVLSVQSRVVCGVCRPWRIGAVCATGAAQTVQGRAVRGVRGCASRVGCGLRMDARCAGCGLCGICGVETDET